MSDLRNKITIRFCTLWLAVLLGLIVLTFFRRRLFPAGQIALEVGEV